MDQRIKEIMAMVFHVDQSIIEDDTSPDTIGTWDSAHHMNMILALEEEFCVEFDNEQIVKLLNYKIILNTIKELKKVEQM